MTGMAGIIKVLIADTQLLFAESLALGLAWQPDLEVIPEHPTTGLEVLDTVGRARPHVVLLDFWIPGMNGAATAREIASHNPQAKVLILSWFHGPKQIQESLDAGVAGFLPKSIHVEQVVEAIRRAYDGEALVFGEQLARLVDGTQKRFEASAKRWERLSKLTPREIEILQLLAQGQPNKELARHLEISTGTLRNHIHKILTKTGARTQLEAITMARHEGLIRETGPPSKGYNAE